MRDLLGNIGLENRIWSNSFEINETIDYENVKTNLTISVKIPRNI